MISAGLEYHITSSEQGAVMLALTVLGTAVDDIRLHLAPPETTRPDQRIRVNTRDAILSKAYQERRRAVHARNAAAFLQNDAQVWCRALEACGVQVPLKKIFRQLKELKNREPRTTNREQEAPAHG